MSDSATEPADAGRGGWPARVAVIGTGAMGGAIAAGLARGPRASAGLEVTDALPDVAGAVAAQTGATVVGLADAASADVVVLAVKPKDAAAALESVASHLGEHSVVVSVVAGLAIERIRGLTRAPVVRLMPSLAVRFGTGLVVAAVSADQEEALTRVRPTLEHLGELVQAPEALFGAATALVGSGPGLLALVAEGLEDGAVACGFSRGDAREMVAATIAGTAALLADGTDPSDLRQRVSSPAGTTVAGLSVLERGAVRAHVADAVAAAARRASEL